MSNNVKSDVSNLKCGVPQGSVLGPILFTIYTSPLCEIIENYNMSYHFYADDSELYLSFEPNDACDEKAAHEKISACLASIKEWMFANKLKLNDEKTEYIIIGRKHDTEKTRINNVTVGNEVVSKTDVVRKPRSPF
jgi:hypothetical protein